MDDGEAEVILFPVPETVGPVCCRACGFCWAAKVEWDDVTPTTERVEDVMRRLECPDCGVFDSIFIRTEKTPRPRGEK